MSKYYVKKDKLKKIEKMFKDDIRKIVKMGKKFDPGCGAWYAGGKWTCDTGTCLVGALCVVRQPNVIDALADNDVSASARLLRVDKRWLTDLYFAVCDKLEESTFQNYYNKQAAKLAQKLRKFGLKMNEKASAS